MRTEEQRIKHNAYMRAYRRSDKQKARVSTRNAKLKERYGLTPWGWELLFVAQDKACAICKTVEPKGRGWMVDHDHATGKVRGILCHNCNTGIGHLRDNQTLLARAAEYLWKATL